MATKRMFSQVVVMSDDFLDMPASSRCLYFSLGMMADDDGFVNNPRSIMRQCGATVDDMRLLLQKGYAITFESGVLVLLHWRINNYLRADRYTPTKYIAEKNRLSLLDNGTYILSDGIPDGIPCGTPDGDTDKVREEEGSIDISSPKTGEGGERKQKKVVSFPHDSNPYKAAAMLSRCVMERYPKCKHHTERDLQRWADAIDKCNRRDGHDWALIGEVLTFSQSNSFWRKNIRSGDTFRDKFDALYAQMVEEGGWQS